MRSLSDMAASQRGTSIADALARSPQLKPGDAVEVGSHTFVVREFEKSYPASGPLGNDLVIRGRVLERDGEAMGNWAGSGGTQAADAQTRAGFARREAADVIGAFSDLVAQRQGVALPGRPAKATARTAVRALTL